MKSSKRRRLRPDCDGSIGWIGLAFALVILAMAYGDLQANGIAP